MSTAFAKRAYPVPVDADQVRADFPSFSFGTFNDPPGQVWSDFTHTTDEFVVVVDGEVEIEVAAEKAVCEPGDLVRIPAGASHTLKTSQAGPSTWVYGYGTFGAIDG